MPARGCKGLSLLACRQIHAASTFVQAICHLWYSQAVQGLSRIQHSNSNATACCWLQVSDDTLTSIFSTILEWHLQSYPNPVKELSKGLVAATLTLYSTASTKLLPTPAKSHYLFNLRDFARVVQVGRDSMASSHVQA